MTNEETMRSEPDPVDLFLSAHTEAPTMRVPESVTRTRLWVEQNEHALRQTRVANQDVVRFMRNLEKPKGSAKGEIVAYAVLYIALAGLAAVAAGVAQ
jgi:hypothetical protein